MTLLQEGESAERAETRIPGEEGIWVLVLGDMTVFALFFVTFMHSRGKNPQGFAHDHASLLLPLGTINTVLLLTSSLLVARAVARILDRRAAAATRPILGALGCGLGFVVVKAVEWGGLLAQHKTVGSGQYYSYYFMFTGIHLAHVLVGLIILARMRAVIHAGELGDKQRRFCEVGGIYWHMVDLLWVMLFALFYLMR